MAILDKKADTPSAANNLRRRMLRSIMNLAKKRKMVTVNPMIEVEPIRYRVKRRGDAVRLKLINVSGGKAANRAMLANAPLRHSRRRRRRALNWESRIPNWLTPCGC